MTFGLDGRAAWLSSAILIASACTPKPEVARVDRILLNVNQLLEDQDREALRDAVRQGVEATPRVEWVEGSDATHRVEVGLTIVGPAPEESEKGGKLLDPREGAGQGEEPAGDAPRNPEGAPSAWIFETHLELRPLDGGREISIASQGTLAADQGRTAVLPLALGQLRDCWTVLAEARKLDAEGEGPLVAALAHEDWRIRDFAIQRLGETKSKTAVTGLIALLTKEGERPELMLRAVGSLVAIGDQSAVPALIDLTARKHPAFVLQLLYAVGAIGGRAAEGFLVTMASGHPNEALQQGAKEALGEMKSRGTASPP